MRGKREESGMKQYVITISRQFGSMGRTIAKRMAEELNIEFYDRDIVEETAKRMGLPVSMISAKEENSNSIYFKRQYPLGMGVSNMQDEIFSIQKNIIEDLAKKESCIIVGRCAESILADFENRMNVYIYAPYEKRLKNCTEILKMEEKVARKMIREVDRSRELYHRRYCPEYQDMFSNRDLMVDSSHFGIEKTAQILTEIARNLFGEERG
ncbi:MAG: cytidylate kinase-like family protein [bacterium]|nr:cytidylate kinase-like family protein [bacterium]MCM1423633.1 cytidylate kinase-like family protein [bacterium]